MPDSPREITKEEIDAMLPTAPVLSDAERRGLQQVKGRRLPFIFRALVGAVANPEAVPSKVKVGEWETQQADFLAADEIEAELMKRLASVRLFKAGAGSAAYGSSRKFYRFLRDNLADYPEQKPLLDELLVAVACVEFSGLQRFARARRARRSSPCGRWRSLVSPPED